VIANSHPRAIVSRKGPAGIAKPKLINPLLLIYASVWIFESRQITKNLRASLQFPRI
jgi:hypothetical protein